MKQYIGSDKIIKPIANACVALGNFDGVHLGHQHLILLAYQLAKQYQGTSVVYTFDPHPAKVLAPEGAPSLIQTLNQKLSAIADLGIDVCIVEKFTKEFAHQTPEQFFIDILVKRLGVRAIVVGYDFTFGFHRVGTVEIMNKLGKKHNIEVEVIDAKFSDEDLLSSTEIRNLISAGMVDKAKTMLGRPYRLEGKVTKGQGIGGQLGAHTANLEALNELLPGNGIYLTKTYIDEELKNGLPSVSSVGTNPTFGGKTINIETHILDFNQKLFGKIIAVDFLEKMRDQIAFASQDELADQIKKDLALARRKHDEKKTENRSQKTEDRRQK